MTPEQHREQAEVLLAEARDATAASGDPKSPSYERRVRIAELAAQRAIGHALLGGPVPQTTTGFDGGKPADLDGGTP